MALGDRDKAESAGKEGEMRHEDEGTKRSGGQDRGRADGWLDGWMARAREGELSAAGVLSRVETGRLQG